MTHAEFLTHLRADVSATGTQRAWARKHGVQEPTLSQVLTGQRDATEAIANACGFVRKVAFYVLEKQGTT